MSDNNDSPHTTLNDCDPNWQYMGDTWGTNHTDDPLVGQYYEATFESTTVHKAFARLCWTGTKVEVFGGKRKNHGLYTVSIDNGEIVWLNGYSEKPQIQALLYGTQDLEWGNHQIVLTNMPKTNMTNKDNLWFDIDYAEISGWPIDCKDLPEATVTPTETMIPASAIAHMTNTSPTASSGSNSTNSTTVNSTSGSVQLSGVSTASLTSAPSTSNGSVSQFTSTSPSSNISPTTTVILSSATISNATSTFGGSSASATNTTSNADRLRSGTEGQLALCLLLGVYLFKMII
ncbi:uncharacterized protein I206_106065 [Kwoniella pini CBS 10737]|uniref:Uncharacterized protein n=1 Tax=Kwoniella pini CBS 10737 TaxID=1296096 RepID=A0AAJ8L9L7_9TREE